MKTESIIESVGKYYSEKIKKFGPVPEGVDWNGAASQNLRFGQLVKLLDPNEQNASMLDFGCGYGALLDYLLARDLIVNYTGYDISRAMIEQAVNTHRSTPASWISNQSELSCYDYVVASGVFNVKGSVLPEEWEQYLFKMLSYINSLALKGFAFNLLTDYADASRMRKDLFYESPSKLFDYCKTTFSKSVALLHDYPLYEFTILVRKNSE
ncbi:MAG TPA: class I SAM-dependent methyltransferase [Cyclobacteriaceae bacterium]|jgi:cyclopropane fatty-acyl-phospholipid synthase-like methyltransferase|nr:class I SAM-dependent methyltransferase [Cyclobacteriaceae bacterium]